MNWGLAWIGLVGVVLAGYLTLEGRSIGIGLVAPVLGRTPQDRTTVFSAIGPFHLGNEVWIVTAVGLIVGGFPIFEGVLLGGLFPVFAAFVVAMVVRGAGMQLRLRRPGAVWRRSWSAAVTVACLVLALALGTAGGLLMQALPLGPDRVLRLPVSMLVEPFTLACAATAVAVFALHGTNFAGIRLAGELGDRAARLGTRLGPVVLVGLVASAVLGVLSGPVRAAVQTPVVVVVGLAVSAAAVVAGDVANWRGRPRMALWCSAAVLALALATLGLARLPYLVVSDGGPAVGMTVAEGAAEPAVLAPLFWVVALLLPILLALQYLTWRLFRGRVGAATTTYF